MKKISNLTYEANIKTFHKYLEAKHEMPFREIQIKNISEKSGGTIAPKAAKRSTDTLYTTTSNKRGITAPWRAPLGTTGPRGSVRIPKPQASISICTTRNLAWTTEAQAPQLR